MQKGSWRVRLHYGSVQIANIYNFFPLYFLCCVMSSPSFSFVVEYFCLPFFPEQTGMPIPTAGMPACIHSSLAGTSEKSLLPVKVHCWVLGLLNSLKIFTGVLNRMQSSVEWKKCLCVLGMQAWCYLALPWHSLCWLNSWLWEVCCENTTLSSWSHKALCQWPVIHVSIFFLQAPVWMIPWEKCPSRLTCTRTQELGSTRSQWKVWQSTCCCSDSPGQISSWQSGYFCISLWDLRPELFSLFHIRDT